MSEAGAAAVTPSADPAPAPVPAPAPTPPLTPGLTVAAVARRLGIAPATLRTWDRRYGLGPTVHEAGTRRRYSEDDLGRLLRMRRLVHEGAAPADAAAAVQADRGQLAPEREPHRPGGPGGRVLAVGRTDPLARGLGRAALALDAVTVVDHLRRAVAARGVVATWDEVLRPVLDAVGRRWSETGEGVEVEHLLSECAAVALRPGPGAPEAVGRPVLLACTPAEPHSLPLHAVAGALAERGVDARVLGPTLPVEALAAAARRSGPAAVFVWCLLPRHVDPGAVTGLPALRPPPAVVCGGPGWGDTPPAGAALATSLPHAVELLTAAATGPR